MINVIAKLADKNVYSSILKWNGAFINAVWNYWVNFYNCFYRGLARSCLTTQLQLI